MKFYYLPNFLAMVDCPGSQFPRVLILFASNSTASSSEQRGTKQLVFLRKKVLMCVCVRGGAIVIIRDLSKL